MNNIKCSDKMRGRKPLANVYNTVINIVDINPNISKITLKVNGPIYIN